MCDICDICIGLYVLYGFSKINEGSKAHLSRFRIMVIIPVQDVLAVDERGGGNKWIKVPTHTMVG